MNRWKLVVPVVACMASLFVFGCAAQVDATPPSTAPAAVMATSAPPPVQIEVVPVAPSIDHVWIKGYWHWNGAQWAWRPGHYDIKRGYSWVPAHYDEKGSSWSYVEGHWVAR
jgi:WXXGXW repeat (2 copies)